MSLIASSVRSAATDRARLAASAALAASLVSLASGQPTSAASPVSTSSSSAQPLVQLEAFEVTGSSIKRIDAQTALPVLTLTADDITSTGVSNAEQLIKTITVTATLGATEVANTGAGGGQGGNGSVSLISLRGLGSGRTLVLINGRRSAPAGGNGAVDIASIPLAAIDRVEVLKDGASAIYGSDAVAGVVNFILKRQFSGAEFSTTIGTPTRQGGGTEHRISVFTGVGDVNTDHYSVTLGASYAQVQPIFGDRRTFARNIDVGSRLDKTSTTSFPSNVRLNNGTLASPNYPNCAPYSLTSTLSPGLCRYDNAPYIALQPRGKLLNLNASGRYKASSQLELYAEPMYTRNKTLNSTQHVLINGSALPAGAPYIATLTNLLNTQYPQYPQLRSLIGSAWALLPPSSPYYPTAWANSNGLTGQPLVLLFRSIPTGVRQTEDLETNYRFVAGLRGLVTGWDYDGGFLYSRNRIQSTLKQGWALFDKYLPLVNSGVINPFGPTTDANALKAAMDSNYNGVFTTVTTTLEGVNGKATRELFRLPAGMINFAIGGEYRREKLDIDPSAANRNFQVSGFGAAGVPTSASRWVGSAYSEVSVPVIRKLELDGAVRYDAYKRTGETTNPKASLRYQPFQQLLLRGAIGTGFRSPTLFDQFQPQARGITTNGSRDLVRCPPGTTGIIDCSTQFVTLGGGNPNLQPEKSLSKSVGVTFEPLKNYSLTVDYFRIEIKDIIRTGVSTATILADPVTFASYVHRGAPDGNASGVGPILGIDQNLTNLGRTNLDGFDVEAAARAAFQGNKLALRGYGTYLTRYDQQNLNGSFSNAINQPAALGIGVALRWRHHLNLSWQRGLWAASLGQNYQVGYHDLRTSLQTPANTPVPRRVSPYETYDAQLSYSGIKRLRLTVGAKNLLDRDPPYTNYGAGFVGGYDLSYTDVRGRFVYVMATYSFKGR